MAELPADEKANGGPGSIAEQLVDHRVDVILGGGTRPLRADDHGGPYAGKTVVDQAAGARATTS